MAPIESKGKSQQTSWSQQYAVKILNGSIRMYLDIERGMWCRVCAEDRLMPPGVCHHRL